MAAIEQAPKLINDVLYRLINKSLDYTLVLIEKRIDNIQSRFFTYLANASGIIGASNTPSLQSDGKEKLLSIPNWPRFRKDYASKKNKSYRNRFFINTGELKHTLQGMSANKIFGKPVVFFLQPGQNNKYRTFESRPKGGYLSTNPKGFKPTQQIGTISIDFFPKLQTDFKTQYGPKFFRDFFNQKQSTPAGHKPVFLGMKLDNHYTKRPFIGQYMQWWVKVKAKQSVLKGIA